MNKLVVLLATVVAAVCSVQAGNPAQCVDVDLRTYPLLQAINNMIGLVATNGMLSYMIPDPLVTTDKRLDAVPFSILSTDFTLTPIIKSLKITGLKDVVPYTINATTATAASAGFEFTGELTVDMTMDFEIAQLNNKWWCWANIFKPFSCPTTTMGIDLGLGLLKPGAIVDLVLSMVQCPANDLTCHDITMLDIMTDVIYKNYADLATRFPRRMKALSISGINLWFDQMTKLNFVIHNTGPVLQELGQKLLGFTTTEINKKGILYTDMKAITQQLIKTLVNQLITDKIKFGGTCYDV